ncbi:MAG: sodium:panthothenate symporter [Lentisphaeria bacterium]|nr:sodium:panthothenate symporter [Lentisphaeria bacterium]
MHWLDWVFALIPLVVVIGVGLYAQRYVKGVSDFLAAGRVAGRYVIAVAGGEAAMGLISVIALVERYYASGFGFGFWSGLTAPLSLLFALTGYCTYRYRETKALTLGQFFEIRYNKAFRIYASILQATSGILNYAIFPAVGARFLIYFLDLPIFTDIFGWHFPTFGLLMAGFLTVAVIISCCGGQVTIMVTDCIQGILSYPMYLIIIVAIFWKMSYMQDMAPVLLEQEPGKSFLNPYDISQLRTFNLFYVLVGIISTVLNRMAWNSSQGYNAAAINAHEQKMGGLLGTWRGGFSYMMILIIAIATLTYMNNVRFRDGKTGSNSVNRQLALKTISDVLSAPEYDKARAEISKKVDTALPRYDVKNKKEIQVGQTGDFTVDGKTYKSVKDGTVDNFHRVAMEEIKKVDKGRAQTFHTIHNQMRSSLTMREMLPIGVTGLFCAIMFFLMLSTDTTYMHSWGSTLIQDVIVPIFNLKLTPKQHLWLLRCGIVFVALVAWFFSFYFAQLDYILMFFAITGAIWLGGAGPTIVLGLYWKRGTAAGAFCSLACGSTLAVTGIIFQKTWVKHIYPWLEANGYLPAVDKALRAASAPFEPYLHWWANPNAFPLNSQEIYAIAIVISVTLYIVVSLLTCRKPFNMDKMLHRGIYSETGVVKEPPKITWKRFFSIFIGITDEYKKGDKILAWSVFSYSFGYSFVLLFIGTIVWNAFYRWPAHWWVYRQWLVSIAVASCVGIISTVWFTIGGTRDLIRLFKRLNERQNIDENDDGSVKEEKKSDK